MNDEMKGTIAMMAKLILDVDWTRKMGDRPNEHLPLGCPVNKWHGGSGVIGLATK
jgi:hypothetical protein